MSSKEDTTLFVGLKNIGIDCENKKPLNRTKTQGRKGIVLQQKVMLLEKYKLFLKYSCKWSNASDLL